MDAYWTAALGSVLADVPFSPAGVSVLCDVFTGRPRPIVPIGWRRRVFNAVHGLGHPSIRATSALVADKFVWLGLCKQVAAWARACIPCQMSKVQRHVQVSLQDFVVTRGRFQPIHVDLVGPLPTSRGATHLLTIVDHYTR